MRYLKNKPCRYTMKCKGKKCSWRIHASVMPDGVTYQVKTIKGKHCCKRQLDNPTVTCSWIAKKLFHDVKVEPNISVTGMSKILMRKFNLHKKHNTIWRAKVKILRLIKGNHEDGFNLLARYTEMIKSSNQGSICYIKWHDRNVQGLFSQGCLCYLMLGRRDSWLGVGSL